MQHVRVFRGLGMTSTQAARTAAESRTQNANLGRAHQKGLAVQLTWISVGLGVCLLLVSTFVGWWAVQRIDDRALTDQSALARAGLQEQADQLPLEQDSSAVWDDAVIAIRANDGPWMAENLVEWPQWRIQGPTLTTAESALHIDRPKQRQCRRRS